MFLSGLVARNLIYADVRLHIPMTHRNGRYPHGDGDCAAPGCDCGKAPCGFYLWNHSSTAVVNNQTFQDWFINDYMLNKVGMSPLVSGFFWDDFWRV